jgi:general secretion pathway protein K
LSNSSDRQQGFALLVVLWTLALLMLLETQFAASGRSDIELARNLRSSAEVQAAAYGGAQEAIFRLLDASRGQWRADGMVRRIRVGAAIVEVSATDEGAKLNLNLAPEVLLRSLLRQCGAEPHSAMTLAAAIVDWRTAGSEPLPYGAKAPQYAAAARDYAPPNNAFRSVAELRAVLGMTPGLFDCLRPHLTVFTDANPELSSADPIVAAAMQTVTRAGGFTGGNDMGDVAVATITAIAHLPDGAAGTVRIVARLNARPSDLPYEVLAWERPGS